MRLTPQELVWKALLALDDAVERAQGGETLPKSLMLRFTLAYLYSVAEPATRPDFAELWRLLTHGEIDAAQQTGRSAMLTHHYNRICIAIGWERTLALMQYLSAARSTEKKVTDEI